MSANVSDSCFGAWTALTSVLVRFSALLNSSVPAPVLIA